MLGPASLLAFAALWTSSFAHLVITYPGSRGDNLVANGTEDDNSTAPYKEIIPGSIGINWDKKEEKYTFPYGMQWMYPCGGLPTTKNRTKWPVNGGGVAFQPGWFSGHKTAFIYVNLGIGTEPPNMSHPMNPVFQLVGPSNLNYSGTVCLPQVGLPANYTPKVGDNATIQVIETAVHGAALYSCVDITFAEDKDVAPLNTSNCFNGSDPQHTHDGSIGSSFVFTTNSLSGAERMLQSSVGIAMTVSAGLGLFFAGFL